MKDWIRIEEEARHPVIVFRDYEAAEDGDILETMNLDEVWRRLPARYVVCGYCSGTGTSSAYLGAFTADEWSQESVEFREDYLAGAYDRECPECGGKRVVAMPRNREDYDTQNQQVFDRYRTLMREEREYEAMCAAELRMGC
jgi:rRNA maturation protein Nop10